MDSVLVKNGDIQFYASIHDAERYIQEGYTVYYFQPIEISSAEAKKLQSLSTYNTGAATLISSETAERASESMQNRLENDVIRKSTDA